MSYTLRSNDLYNLYYVDIKEINQQIKLAAHLCPMYAHSNALHRFESKISAAPGKVKCYLEVTASNGGGLQFSCASRFH